MLTRMSSEETPAKAGADDVTERKNHARLCQYFKEAAVLAMREVFDRAHPPISLAAHLAEPDTHKTLRRLKVQGVISAEQWQVLYPTSKRHVTSARYDAVLLYTLLRHVCRLAAPYPNEWSGEPLAADESLGAALVRLHGYLRSLATSHSVSDQHLHVHLDNIHAILRSVMGSRAPQAAVGAAAVGEEAVRAVQQWHAALCEQRGLEKRLSDIDVKRQSKHDLVKLSAGIGRPSRSVTSAAGKPVVSGPGPSSSSHAKQHKTGDVSKATMLHHWHCACLLVTFHLFEIPQHQTCLMPACSTDGLCRLQMLRQQRCPRSSTGITSA